MHKFYSVDEAVRNSCILLAGMLSCNHHLLDNLTVPWKKWLNAITFWYSISTLEKLLSSYICTHFYLLELWHHKIIHYFIIAFLNNKRLEKWKYQLNVGSVNCRTSLQCSLVQLFRKWDSYDLGRYIDNWKKWCV